jgi:hypothetical protein
MRTVSAGPRRVRNPLWCLRHRQWFRWRRRRWCRGRNARQCHSMAPCEDLAGKRFVRNPVNRIATTLFVSRNEARLVAQHWVKVMGTPRSALNERRQGGFYRSGRDQTGKDRRVRPLTPLWRRAPLAYDWHGDLTLKWRRLALRTSSPPSSHRAHRARSMHPSTI